VNHLHRGNGRGNKSNGKAWMPRDGATVFSDLIGKLDVLRVSCGKCHRSGCYKLNRLVEWP